MTPHVLVPARNEEERLADTLAMLIHDIGAPVTVVDNASNDRTAVVAARAGANVLHEPRAGKGYAALAGIRAAAGESVMLCDADVSGLTVSHIQALCESARETGAPVVRLALGRSPEDAPVTTLAASPLLAALGVQRVAEPLGGLVLVDREFVSGCHLPGGWGFDVALTLAALRQAGTVPEVHATEITHRRKPLREYRDMAEAVVKAILIANGVTCWDHADCATCSVVDASALAADQRTSLLST